MLNANQEITEIKEPSTMDYMNATYSPEDDKIRLYSEERLDKELYDRVRKYGYRYAPAQKLFYAVWTPYRQDLATELCGEIQDEQKSLKERAEERAERFSKYQESRKNDAEEAYKSFKSQSGVIPLGQPILVGHHSEKSHRAHLKRMDNSLKKLSENLDTAKYWESRAENVIYHAAYKDAPTVRARRVKKLEAEKRKYERRIKKSTGFLEMWNDESQELTLDRAKAITAYDNDFSWKFPLSRYPRDENKSQYEGSMSLWSALEFIKPEKAKELSLKAHTREIKHCERWTNHLALRINYEKALLKAQGYIAPEKKKRPKLAPIVNYKGEGFKEFTKDEWKKVYNGYKLINKINGDQDFDNYRQRIFIDYDLGHENRFVPIFITNQKVVERPSKRED